MSGEGALEDDLLGGLEVGLEDPREGGREDLEGPEIEEFRELCLCLLYTSDAADE